MVTFKVLSCYSTMAMMRYVIYTLFRVKCVHGFPVFLEMAGSRRFTPQSCVSIWSKHMEQDKTDSHTRCGIMQTVAPTSN